MEKIYNTLGFIVWHGLGVASLTFVISKILKFIINWTGRVSNDAWVIVDWAWHRREFKEWLKNEVHPTNRKTKFKEKGEK